MDSTEFLEHYGKRGMKWGHRQATTGTKGFSKDAKRVSSIHKKAKKSPVKVKSLSNEEINTFLHRVSLESRFHQATPSRGQKALKTIKTLLGVGTTVNQVASFSNSPSGKAIRSGLEKKTKAAPA